MAVLNSEAFGSTLIMLLLLGQGRGLWWSPTVQPYRSCAGTPIHPTAPFIGTFLTLHWTFSVSPASLGGGSSRGVETSSILMEMAFGRTHLWATGPLCNGCDEYWRCTKHNHLRTTLYVIFFCTSTTRGVILLVNKGFLWESWKPLGWNSSEAVGLLGNVCNAPEVSRDCWYSNWL